MSTPITVRVTKLSIHKQMRKVSFCADDVTAVHQLEERSSYKKDMYYQNYEYQRFFEDYERAMYRKYLKSECRKKISNFFSFGNKAQVM
ncbi:expressed unknown protein [Seminavis robusta]|uniref:Uncharacterized protein n=1 Tax=Seminavis robusta TaxID=568900 RepID=A0A9N8HEG7_9STRA|nr:expressed unknown protein [Seminavis robusta]|eukprot:Sro514_g158070.1 n/a (89) ;mRNA; f:30798-31064